ncbi:hypothetical protein HYC85_017187 [Camellia sinensis]|uniref:MYB-CC type transcription factor LHEQLE-containing domain-containing protein n=1 Tax=Camellia sinensis TaxID=4442 RepID=A0A7J7H1U8_CAMSI|nr:hypothetical protein HYC85_017187 [Camellia sinensis]
MMERGYGGVGGGGSGYPYESGVVMSRDPKPRLRWTADLHDRFVDAVTKLGGPDNGSYRDYQVHSSSATTHSLGVNTEQGELPIAEALRCQVEVQKRLQEQLEVYLLFDSSVNNFPSIVGLFAMVGTKEVADENRGPREVLANNIRESSKSLTLDMNFPAVSVEATRAQLTNFNLALSNLMENVDGEVRNENNIHKSLLNDINRKANGSLYLGEVEERKDIKLKVEGGSVNFDLNTRGSYDFIGTSRSEMEAKTLAYRS